MALGFLAWARAMAVPLLVLQADLDAGAFAFLDCATQRYNQGLDVREHDRRRSWTNQDGLKRLSLFGVLRFECQRPLISTASTQ
jgi:hypothetical protein